MSTTIATHPGVIRLGTEETLAADGPDDRLTLWSEWTGGTISLTAYDRDGETTYELSPSEATLLRDELTARLERLGR